MTNKPDSSVTEKLRALLPPPNTHRWVASRKAAVVAAVKGGAITEKEAIQRYALTEEELTSWCAALATHGAEGLYATRVRRISSET